MKKEYLSNAVRAALFAVAAFLAVPHTADAQTVTKQPAFVQSQQWVDLGNGPLDIQAVEGSGSIFSSSSSGVGSGTTTAITLTATPAIPPCVGCAISGSTLGPTSIVTAYNGTTGITVNTSQTIPASSALSWGAACPAATAANVPGVAPASVSSLNQPLPVRAAVGGTYPMYTLARLCGWGSLQNGFTFLTFPVGAH